MSKCIIIIDDDDAIIGAAGKILSEQGMRVVGLKSGQIFLDYIKEHGEPDLVLLDIRMPGMNGFEVLRRLRNYENAYMKEETPVIALTADDDSDTENASFEAGVVDYIRKPFDANVLVRRVENALNKQDKFRRKPLG